MRTVHGGDIYRNRVEMDFSVNINPLGIPEGVEKALENAVRSCQCYPDIRAEGLRRAISAMTGVEQEKILCGNGASELFLAIVRGLAPSKILIPVPSFYGYEKAAEAGQGEILYHRMKEDEGFCLTESIFPALTEDIGLLFLANPNNPVGNCLEPDFLERLLRHCMEKNIMVVLDECFTEFTRYGEEHSFLRRTGEFPNLLAVRAFTKIFAMPGVRLGYLVCESPKLRESLKRQLPEWNVSVFAQEAGIAAAQENLYLKETVETVRREREFLTERLRALGMCVYPGEANYLLVYTPIPVGEKLLGQGILIRDCSDFRGLSEGYYRIAVKGRTENEKLIDRLSDIVRRQENEVSDGEDMVL